MRAFFDDWRTDEALPVVSRSVQSERFWSASEVLPEVPKRAKTGIPPGTNLSASKPLKSKAAETHFLAPIPPAERRRRKRSATHELGAVVVAQIEGQLSPARFTAPDGSRCRLWLAGELGSELHYCCNVTALLDNEKKRKRASEQPWKPSPKALRRPIIVVGRNEPVRDLKDALAELRGIRARMFINAQDELQVLGCGQRVATMQLRGNKVLLHHNGNVATMKRPAFKEFIARNKAARARHQAYLKSIRPSATIIPFKPKLQEAA